MNVVYCKNGHYIGAFNQRGDSWDDVQRIAIEEERDDAPHRSRFCAACGAECLNVCSHCATLIRPLTPVGGRPSYCVECSLPFPWTEMALEAAKEYTDELNELNAQDKALLKRSFVELTVDTARTPLAASQFKRIISAVAPAAQDVLSKIVVGVLTDAAKKSVGL